jgi:hypothetical protein
LFGGINSIFNIFGAPLGGGAGGFPLFGGAQLEQNILN